MSQRRLQITVRGLMVLVLLTALSLYFGQILQRREYYLSRAAYYAMAEDNSRNYADEGRGPLGDPRRVARGEQMAVFYAKMRRKYERAAHTLAPRRARPAHALTRESID